MSRAPATCSRPVSWPPCWSRPASSRAGRLAAWAASRGIAGAGPLELSGRGRLAGAPGRGARRARKRGAHPARRGTTRGTAMRIGWLSTGRDQAASNLLADVVARAQHDELPLDIGAVFCDRELDESPASDTFLRLVQRLGFPALSLSSAQSWAEAQRRGQSAPGLAPRLSRAGHGAAQALPPGRAGHGRLHAHREPRLLPRQRAAQPAPGAARAGPRARGRRSSGGCWRRRPTRRAA